MNIFQKIVVLIYIRRVSHTIVLDDPFDDPEGLAIPDRSPEPTQEQLDVGQF